MTVRTRFAPSPTGPLHIGGARTALFSFLYAKQHHGAFILRIEDTDAERSRRDYEKNILEGLRWLGIHWDEGPYRQSEKKERYKECLQKLISVNAVYPCYCTPDELEAVTTKRAQQHLPPKYSGKCREATVDERTQWQQEGRRPAYRFRTNPKDITFTDIVRGLVTIRAELLDDFIVARSGGEVLYNLAVVIDDADMKISHVIRGEEHLSNTPKQLLLYESLGLKPPQFAHLPLLLGQNRAKLSKRDSATSVLDYREAGYLPEALVSFLALLGWNPKTVQEVFTMDELIKLFRLEHVQKAGAIVDTIKLDHFNGKMIRSLSAEGLTRRSGLAVDPKAIALVQDRMRTLKDIESLTRFLTDYTPAEKTVIVPKKGSEKKTHEVLTVFVDYFTKLDGRVVSDPKKLHDQTVAFIKSRGYTTAEALWPLRVAFTGLEHSPGVFDVAAYLGKEEVLKRIAASLQKF